MNMKYTKVQSKKVKIIIIIIIIIIIMKSLFNEHEIYKSAKLKGKN